MNFENIAKDWIENKKVSIKKSTYYNYLFIIEKYLNPEFKGKNIKKIKNYNDYIQKLSENLSAKTVRDIANVLKVILKYYEDKYDYILQINKINMPRVAKKRVKILSTEEKSKLEKYCVEKNTLKALGIIICLNTGMRIGEICSLKWKDIDLEMKKIYVDKTMQRIYNKNKKSSDVIIDRSKTECSIRDIPINKNIYGILKQLKKKYKDNDYFLSGKEDKIIEPRNYQYTFKTILKQCKIRPYKFHILRHTFATNCIEVGLDAKSLSEILGHSNVNITLGIYIHSSDRIKKKYLEKL
ncbi:MAG TPA: site-specific integrase [Candidatus Merdicola faecigallinarum]|uniref:Site-specific integrase n=1 Tax=Candidatus Merdicola faecigallinarum TaxID=2840862 RepID=A0A9D1S9B8_9FIRM|nr:site-specific integrase [Candidatus Merdicola faecigallinarum]